jgi:hypothetical protein
MISILFCLLALCLSSSAFAQYNKAAGQSAPRVQERIEYTDDSGVRKTRTEYVAPKRDQYGNANGSQFDLAVDGAFEGQTVAVLQLYQFDFEQTRQALKQKGFGVYRWNSVPPIDEFKKSLAKACQFWIISDAGALLTDEHIAEIKKFFESGRGVYIWGDNQPYYADANRVGKALIGAEMLGDTWGDQVVQMKERKDQKSGIVPNLLLSTGIEQIYEGITIATIQPTDDLQPLIYGSAGNLVTAFYDKNGRRAVFDGGFTRLYNKWDTAGTGRYVMNAAAWLTNAERFGEKVIGMKTEKK